MEDQGSASPDSAMEDPDSASLQAAMDAPITASLGPMGPLLRQLHSRPKGVGEDKIQLLKDGLVGLCISLKDVSEAEGASLTAKWWMKEVRELCYDTQDYLDEVFMKHSGAGARRSVRLSATFRVGSKLEWRPQIGKKAQGRRCGASRLQKISTKKRNLKRPPQKVAISFSELMARMEVLSDVSERFELGLEAIKPDRARAVRRLTTHLSLQLPASPASITARSDSCGLSFVDIEEPVNKLVNLLAFDDDNQKQLKVVSIFGFSGVGKTSVATTLYRNFRGKFQYRAFLRVSRTPDMIGILTSILSQIKAPQVCGFPDAQALIDNIRGHLQGKRYFIIIDDLWTTTVWNIIRCAFPDGDCRSRILTTTETEDISLACCSYDLTYIFQMRPLNDDKSRKLFFNRVFSSEDGCPLEFREVSYGIIRQCGGSPLATVVVASMLAWEPNLVLEQWKHIQDSLSSIVSTKPTSERTKEVLNLIYSYLPPHLKTCLLHLGVYPEGYTIGKDDLVKQWVAEGFLGAMEEGQNKEKIAEAYFYELVSREMVQAVDTNYSGDVLFCTVHQMVLDFIRDKTMEENFAITVDYFQSTLALPDKVRRLSVQFGGAKGAKIPEDIIISQVRSLLFFGFFKCVPLILGYGLLRVLVLHIWADEGKIIDLSRISELCRLIYLKIKCNTTIKLPAKIGGIQNLETLEVDARLSVVPSDIVHLENLLHLRLPSESYLPHGLGHMTSLRTLGYFDIGRNSENNVMDLGKLTNLKDLQLTCSTVQAAEYLEKNLQLLGSILEKLNILQSVTLVPTADSNVNTLQDDVCAACMSISRDSMSSVFPASALLERFELLPRICIFPGLPNWFEQLGKLRILKIAVRELCAADIAILKALPALTALSLYVQTASVEIIVFDKTGFLVLSYFKFRCSTPLLKFESDAMPNLLKLKLSFNAVSQVKQHATTAISIEHLSGLKEISTKIRGAGAISIEHLSGVKHITTKIWSEGADPESAWMTTISNDKNNPTINVQLVGCIFNGNQGTETEEIPHIAQDKVKLEGEKEELNDTRNFTTQPLSSSHLLTPGSESSQVVRAKSKAQLQDGCVSYPWDKKMRGVLPVPNSSSFLSIVVLPKVLDGTSSHYNSIDDTVARANAWFLSAQASGVPVAFLNVQTEALLTKISGDMASEMVNTVSLADLPNLANASLYGLEDYPGGMVKVARIWYTATGGEMSVEITLEEGDTKLGFAISRTEEGFLYISSVMEDDGDRPAPSTRSGLRDLYREAKCASKLLVISRVLSRKVLPWVVSTSGAIRCFDTVSLSQKLSLHRHALRPILLHVLMWDGCADEPARTKGAPPCPKLQPSPALAEVRQDSFAWGDQPGLVQGRRGQGVVVAIECVSGGSRAEEGGSGCSESVQTGDVVEELLIGVGRRGGAIAHAAPFKGGSAALQKLMHAAYKRGDTSVVVHVRRHAQQQLEVDSSAELVGPASASADTTTRMKACIVPQEAAVVGSGGGGMGMVGRSRRYYLLRSVRDPNYAVALVDRIDNEGVSFRGSRSSSALSKTQLHDGYVSYPWAKKMREVLPVPNSSSFLSILVLPTALDRANSRYNSVDDTLARANAWFLSSQASGVPIAFLNVQTEALLTKISGDMASATVNSGSLADLPNLANASLYGFEDYHGVDVGVVKAVRIWFTAAAGEMPMEIILEEGDTKLGFAISRTEEGFLYISSVMEDDDDLPAPSTRSGIRDLYREAKRASKLLVISRVSCRKVLPWMVSTSGAIRCFDTVSVSQKLSLHRHALRPILLHVLMWDGTNGTPARPQEEPPCPDATAVPSVRRGAAAEHVRLGR